MRPAKTTSTPRSPGRSVSNATLRRWPCSRDVARRRGVGGALAGLQKSYPIAMGLLEAAAESGKAGRDVVTSGGRRVRMWADSSTDGDLDRAVSVAAARGRYARNAVIQGAAAEFFKVWAITVRRRGRPLGAEVVLCLHDELLVQVPADAADARRRWSMRRSERPPTTGRRNPTSGSWPMWLSSIVGPKRSSGQRRFGTTTISRSSAPRAAEPRPAP